MGGIMKRERPLSPEVAQLVLLTLSTTGVLTEQQVGIMVDKVEDLLRVARPQSKSYHAQVQEPRPAPQPETPKTPKPPNHPLPVFTAEDIVVGANDRIGKSMYKHPDEWVPSRGLKGMLMRRLTANARSRFVKLSKTGSRDALLKAVYRAWWEKARVGRIQQIRNATVTCGTLVATARRKLDAIGMLGRFEEQAKSIGYNKAMAEFMEAGKVIL